MFRNALYIAVLFLLFSCQMDCKDDAPTPISFQLEFTDSAGVDLYTKDLKEKNIEKKKLKAYYNYNYKRRDTLLNAVKQKLDTTRYAVNMMPVFRRAYTLLIDTIYIQPTEKDIDTIVFKIKKQESKCFSTIYSFEKLTYNGVDISAKDGLHRIKK